MIWYVSDIHIEFLAYNASKSYAQITQDFVQECQSKMADGDALLIAGDISHNPEETLNFLEQLNQANIETYAVMGNHDYWGYPCENGEEVGCRTMSVNATNNYLVQKISLMKKVFLLRTGLALKVGRFTIIGDCAFTYKRDDFNFRAMRDKQYVYHWFEWVKWYEYWADKEDVIVLTHYPVWEWMRDVEFRPRHWYVNGHDHHFISKWRPRIHAKKNTNYQSFNNNQIGYYEKKAIIKPLDYSDKVWKKEGDKIVCVKQ